MSAIGNLLSLLSSRRRTRNYDATNLGLLAEYLEQHLVPVGAIVSKLTDTSPGEGWVRVYGQSLIKADYPDLYAEISGAFGEDADTFNLPDLTDAYLSGAGSSAAGAFLGSNDITLTADQMPQHSHGVTDAGHGHTATSPPHTHGVTAVASGAIGPDNGVVAGNTGSSTTGIFTGAATVTVNVGNATTGISINNEGGGQPFNNRPRSIAVHYFMKAKV